MKLDTMRLLRRTHLYLALVCMPWFLMYGITALPFSHPSWFEKQRPQWQTVGTWRSTVEISEAAEREELVELLRVAGMEDRKVFAGGRDGDTVNVYFPSFWKMERLEYGTEEGTLAHLRADRSFEQILTGMHERGRYVHDSFLSDLWAVFVDLTAFGFLLWVITGIVFWWRIRPMRFWGAVSLGAGCLSFVLFVVLL